MLSNVFLRDLRAALLEEAGQFELRVVYGSGATCWRVQGLAPV